MPQPQPPPDLHIPPSNNTVTVSIIDTTSFVGISASRFMEPHIPGHDKLNAACYAFLIKHNNPASKSKYDTMLFDLGVRKDLENAPKVLRDRMDDDVTIKVDKNVTDIFKDHGEDPHEVGAVIWSHWHFDHTGDPSTFPASTDLIVGPGFKKTFVPAYPTVDDSPVDERAWEGRTLREIDFDAEGGGLKLGQYKAFDFYGDGSFYFLDTPGHAVGHMCGLARTSADPPEFIFMGGDIAHHGGEFRPTRYLSLPDTVEPNPLVAPYTKQAPTCPGAIFEAIHPHQSSIEPFYVPTSKGVHADAQETKTSIDKLADFDAQNNVFVNIAHDTSLYDVVEFFPKTANGWSQKRWKEEGTWRFLRDFDTGSEEHES
ncbi:uncharacterized protein LTR77_003981 [Saxophila tyrrhenica]|uniref:Metallo-beta-lactamase domain-containing protein n=1 Tax=Saxophila tyrrhenica TaxID=1690608 RepID=A0AAV9PF43_9PEZI|nr:hypothetical protein LTR77_003981 [Saxophila tyrrhenica]